MIKENVTYTEKRAIIVTDPRMTQILDLVDRDF